MSTTYKVLVQPFVREFLNSRETTSLEVEWTIEADTLGDFVSELWFKCEPYLKREIVIDPLSKVHSFVEKEAPDYTDLDKFVKFRDPVSKYTYALIEVTEIKLGHWSDGRRINVIIFPHSFSIVYRKQWDSIKSGPTALLAPTRTDKAGAPTEAEVEAVAIKLQEIHRMNYTGRNCHWSAWAEHIVKKGPLGQEALMLKPPPKGLMKLFETAHSNHAIQILSIRQNVNVAEGINHGFGIDIAKLIEEYKQIVRASEVKLSADKQFLESLVRLQEKVETNEQNLSLFGTAVQARDNPMSEEYLNTIGIQDDEEHREEELPFEEDELPMNEEYLDDYQPSRYNNYDEEEEPGTNENLY